MCSSPSTGTRARAGDLKARTWAPSRSLRPLANRGVEAADAADRPSGRRSAPSRPPGRLRPSTGCRNSGPSSSGDVLLGAGAKPRATDDPLRLCPEGWLGKPTHDDLRESLRPLLDLPVEHVLVSHGAPVLGGGKAALERVLAST